MLGIVNIIKIMMDIYDYYYYYNTVSLSTHHSNLYQMWNMAEVSQAECGRVLSKLKKCLFIYRQRREHRMY